MPLLDDVLRYDAHFGRHFIRSASCSRLCSHYHATSTQNHRKFIITAAIVVIINAFFECVLKVIITAIPRPCPVVPPLSCYMYRSHRTNVTAAALCLEYGKHRPSGSFHDVRIPELVFGSRLCAVQSGGWVNLVRSCRHRASKLARGSSFCRI